MFNQYPAPPPLPIDVPAQLKKDLTQIMGDIGVSELGWVTLSLIHDSYLNEQNDDFVTIGITNRVFDYLGSIGAVYTDLILLHLAYKDPHIITTAEANQFANQFRSRINSYCSTRFGLLDYAFLSKGQMADKDNFRLAFTLGRQFLGAIRVCYGYNKLFSLINNSVGELSKTIEPNVSYKNILQVYSQELYKTLPKYSVIEEKGPDHNKNFVIRVFVEKYYANGEGKSKNRAAENAAHNYLIQFAPKFLQDQTRESKNAPISQGTQLLLAKHKTDVENLCKRLGIPGSYSWLVGRALIHRSYINESQLKQSDDNERLSQLGAYAIRAFASDFIASKLIFNSHELSGQSLESLVSSLYNNVSMTKVVDDHKLGEGFLVGRGQQRAGITDDIKADILQAIIGAYFIAQSSMGKPPDTLPDELYYWINNSYENLITGRRLLADPIPKLLDCLQSIRMKWGFRYQSIGMGLDCKYGAAIDLESEFTKETFSVKSKSVTNVSKQQATKQIATSVGHAIEVINGGLDIDSTETLWSRDTFQSFAVFLLRHELAGLPKSRREIKKWHNIGILGCQLLSQGNTINFLSWAQKVDVLLKNNGSGMDVHKISQFYQSVGLLSPNKYRKLIIEWISKITRYIDSINPDENKADIRTLDEFKTILSFSKIYKLLSQNFTTINISELINDFELLRHGRSPLVQIKKGVPKVCITERAGIYQTLLAEILALVEADRKDNSIEMTVLDITEKNEIVIQLVLEHPLERIENIRKETKNDLLWNFLFEEVPLVDIIFEPRAINILCVVHNSPTAFGENVLLMFRKGTELSQLENEAISQLLHDLKNQLIAYQVSLGSSGSDRTSILQSKYQASLHLDNAASLCRSLSAISYSMVNPILSKVDIDIFIRRYIAEKLLVLPSNIRLDPPKTTGKQEIISSIDFLRSIFDNLIKNSVEAMPNGGEIQIDWLYDDRERTLLIEIKDTGPGIDDEYLHRLLAGEIHNSNKQTGTAIGILSVRSMIQQLGGSCSISSSVGKGAQWSITLPSLEDITSPIDAVHDENATYSIEEGDIR